MLDPTITLSQMPLDLYRDLARSARKNGRSIEAETLARLKASVPGGPVRFNVLKDQLGTAPDFTKPLSEEELAEWENSDPRS